MVPLVKIQEDLIDASVLMVGKVIIVILIRTIVRTILALIMELVSTKWDIIFANVNLVGLV